MPVLLGVLALVVMTRFGSTEVVHPIEIEPDHESIAWAVELQDQQASCSARAWIGRMGDQPLATLFSVELDEAVAPTAAGETPLLGLPSGTYDLHFEAIGCQWAFVLISR